MKRLFRLSLRVFIGLWIGGVGLGGCASIQPPDGGPPDTTPPTLRRWKVNGASRYKLYWSEYLQPLSSSTALWYNPTTSDSLERGRVRLRGKRLIVLLPSTARQLWVGPGIRDFTAGNATRLQVIPEDTGCVRVRLLPAPEAKKVVWVLVEKEGAYYRFLAEGDSVLVCGVEGASFSRAYAWEDIDGDGLWRSGEERLWLPFRDSLVWVQVRLDTVGPRPKQVFLWGLYAVLRFEEPVSALGLPLAENLWVVKGDSAVFTDSIGFRKVWRRVGDEQDTMGPVLGWPWRENSQGPLVVLGVLDTVRRDTFFHLVLEGRDTLVPACTEPWRWYLSSGKGSATLYSQSGRELAKMPLAKVPTVLVGSAGWVWVYTPSVLGHAGRLLAQVGDTLWLPPGSYGVRRGAPAEGPLVVLEAGWPKLAAYLLPARIVEIAEADSLVVVQVEED